MRGRTTLILTALPSVGAGGGTSLAEEPLAVAAVPGGRTGAAEELLAVVPGGCNARIPDIPGRWWVMGLSDRRLLLTTAVRGSCWHLLVSSFVVAAAAAAAGGGGGGGGDAS